MKFSGTESWLEEAQKQCAQKWAQDVNEILFCEVENTKSKEDNTMKVSYKGITGELVRLERIDVSCACTTAHPYRWELDIYDREKDCKVQFSGIPMKDVKFLGGEATYG